MSIVSGEKVTLLVFVASEGGSAPERLVGGARLAAAHDLVELGLSCPLIDRVIVATGSDDFAARVRGYDRVLVDRDRPGEPFHFGRRLLEVIETHGVRRPLYFGGAGAPLCAPESLEALCGDLVDSEGTVVANGMPNGWSADFFGFTPPEALRRVELPADQDNNLPFLLTRFGGLRLETLEPAVENTFDIDTPTDLAVLKLQAAARPHLRRYLDSVAIDTRRLELVMPLLIDLRTQTTLIGRVKTDIWGRAGTDIPGPKRLFVEERGMKGSSRAARGEVRSLVGYLAEAAGFERLFAYLAGMSDAVFFDTRVLFHHLRLDLRAADRFASDLGDLDAIGDPIARSFTAAALACAKPVILGGQNIVAGGLWALVQESWNRSDAGLLRAD